MSPSDIPTVLIIGPSSVEVGGMASVMAQMQALDLLGRYRLRAFHTTRSPQEGESAVQRVVRHWRHLRQLRRTIADVGAEVVHVHTCSGFSFYRSVADLMVANAAGCRTVLHVHGASFDEFHARAGRLGKVIIREAFGAAGCVIALSDHWRSTLRAMSLAANVRVIENAVDLPNQTSPAAPNRKFRFLLLARMDVWKGIDDLLSATAMLRQTGAAFEVVLAGPEGSAGDAATLAQKIEHHGLAGVVRYLPPVHGDRKAALLASTDVYVQPSHHEGMPISLLEALAAGLPVIATKVGAVPEVITHGLEGLLIPPKHPDLLASAMNTMLLDAHRRATMAKAARSLAEARFGPSRFRDDLIYLYDAVRAARPIRVPPRPVVAQAS